MERTLQEVISQRRRQMLVHSFLYYILDNSIVADTDYDRWYKELVSLQRQYPEIAAQCPYHELCMQFNDQDHGSGFWIRPHEYPLEMVTVAYRLLRYKEQHRES